MAKLAPGDAAPDFTMNDADGNTWRLGDLRGKKVILFFYPADDTPGCTAEACDFRDARAELADAGYVVLGASPQGAKSHAAFATKFRLNFPLLIDEDMSVAQAYAAAGDLGDYKGIPLRVIRSTFVINEEGVIRHALYGVNARSHVAELQAVLV
ncbi:MAG: peroxiredoxin [Actinomycetota bacterium]